MFYITLEEEEAYDEATNRFYTLPRKELVLEHSLLSLSKWEEKYKKPFLGYASPLKKKESEKTRDELLDYVAMMSLSPMTKEDVYRLSASDVKAIVDYIAEERTATWFSSKENQGGRPPRQETITSEIIYYWMFTLQIPKECEEWHLSRLLTLIRVMAEKNQPKKQRRLSRAQIARANRAENAARRKRMGSAG